MKRFVIIAAILIVLISSCKDDNLDSGTNDSEYKQKMREFVIEISEYSKGVNPDFNIIPQNGIELVSITEMRRVGKGSFTLSLSQNRT